MLQTIRHSLGNDSVFRNILRGLNKQFYHQTVTSSQIENFISTKAGFNYKKIFDQYLRTVQIPVFEYYFNKDSTKLFYHYSNCVKGFNLPLFIYNENSRIKIYPTDQWKVLNCNKDQAAMFSSPIIEEMYYIKTSLLKKP